MAELLIRKSSTQCSGFKTKITIPVQSTNVLADICMPYLAMWLHQFRKSTCIKFKEMLKTALSCCRVSQSPTLSLAAALALPPHFTFPLILRFLNLQSRSTPHTSQSYSQDKYYHVKVPGSYLSHAWKLPQNFFKKSCLMGWRQKLVVQLLSHRYQQTYGQGGGKCVTSDSKPDCTPNQHLWFTNGAHLSRTHCEPRVAKVPQEAAYQEERNHIINMTPQKGGCFPERLGLRTLLQRQLCWLLLEMTFQMLQPHPATPKFSQEDNYLWRSSVE